MRDRVKEDIGLNIVDVWNVLPIDLRPILSMLWICSSVKKIRNYFIQETSQQDILQIFISYLVWSQFRNALGALVRGPPWVFWWCKRVKISQLRPLQRDWPTGFKISLSRKGKGLLDWNQFQTPTIHPLANMVPWYATFHQTRRLFQELAVGWIASRVHI
jgi:hypothetical protein